MANLTIKRLLAILSFCGIYPVEIARQFGRSRAMNFKVRIGLNIQNLRYSKGLSQEQLALAAQIDRSYISEIEHAKSSVSADKLEQIAHALGIDPSELCKRRDLTMAEIENARLNAAPIGRINCIKTNEEIGLLYRWENGDTQAALFELSENSATDTAPRAEQKPDLGADCG